MRIQPIRIIAFGLLIISACAYDNEEDLFGENDCNSTVSFAQDVQPIIEAHCAIPDCHVSGAQPPNLMQTSTIISRADRIRDRTQSRTMPPSSSGITLTEAEIQTIDCWVQQGANEN